MKGICLLANSLLLGIYGTEARKFSKALGQADGVQLQKLLELLRQNKDTEYGMKYGFSEITSLELFRERVPLTVYEDYLPYVERIGNGEKKVLTEEPVKLFEITSGSVSASKLIPYTDSLKAEFQAGIKPWLWDLYTRFPKVRSGKSYWSITPLVDGGSRTKAGIPIGFEEDAEYFGGFSRHLMNLIFVSPKGVKQERDMEVFYFKTTLALLKTRELSLISLWNPTFLFLLTDYMKEHRKQLLSALPKKRAAEIGEALERGDYRKVWPDLCVISCWCDGAAAGFRQQLSELFPQAYIQPKGLLATEGFLTFPWGEMEGGILGVRSHFVEFCNMRTQEFSVYSRLEPGESYEVILTTGGGFYRYCIGDVVEVTGLSAEHGLPVLRFAGKTGNVSDLFGEKLNELFLRQIFREIETEYELEKRFYLMAPEGNHYVLYLEALQGAPDWKAGTKSLEESLEQLLCRNFHYSYCRRLGQLEPVQVCSVYGSPRQDYLRFCMEKGQKLGNIKNQILSVEQGFGTLFEREENL